jgi:hypothetical protein
MTFLILFLGAFGLAWPIAVRIAEALIRWRGYEVKSQPSGGNARRDVVRKKTTARPLFRLYPTIASRPVQYPTLELYVVFGVWLARYIFAPASNANFARQTNK